MGSVIASAWVASSGIDWRSGREAALHRRQGDQGAQADKDLGEHDEHDFGAALEAGAKLAQRVLREPEAKPDVTMDHADLRMSLP
jgi:hypothetical protein